LRHTADIKLTLSVISDSVSAHQRRLERSAANFPAGSASNP
jgi:hypothetical protein